jgi:hypothetical protein
MIFKYNVWLEKTWELDGKQHQIDPLSMVANPTNKEEMVPLYTLLNITKEEAKAISTPIRLEQLRKERNKLIADTDWWVLTDRTATDAQIQYRQQLRDITNDFDCENEIIFPSKP